MTHAPTTRRAAALPGPCLSLPFSTVIPGAPRTKKNHGKRIKRGNRIYNVPSDAYTAWNELAVVSLMRDIASLSGPRRPIAVPVNCRALFFREALTGDAVGYYQALADTLENAGIVEDDKLIVSWDGTRILKDAACPRIIVTLEAAV